MILYELTNLAFVRNEHFTLRIGEFRLERGEKVAIVGQNGSGKTTLLRLLSFLEQPDSWTRFRYRGRPHTPGKEDRRGLGYLKQQPYLFYGTVRQNLAYPLKLRRLPAREAGRRLEEMLATLNLEHLAQAPARQISGGEQKRLALGRSLLAEPDLLLLDEPIAHLDRYSRSVIETVLKRAPLTILFTTHNLHFAHRLADRVLNLIAGRINPGLSENILEGRFRSGILETAGGLRIPLPGMMKSPPEQQSLTVMIDPHKLRISVESLPLAENGALLRGRISYIREQGSDVWLEVDCGDRLIAIISRDSYERLGTNLHAEVLVSFDRDAVAVL